jgi:hypothetical protein
MAMVRTVSVGFQGANRKIEQISSTIPADWVTGDRDALHEIYNNEKLRTRISVAPSTAIWAEISAPFDDSPVGFRAF